MRGQPIEQPTMLCLISMESLVPKDHPLRSVKRMADEALRKLSPVFDRMYAATGRPSVPPERLLKSLLLIALHSVRSERLFCEQLRYNLLFRWFLDMEMTEEAFDASTFSQNQQRLLRHDVSGKFFHAVVGHAKEAGLLSAEHFSVDGTLIEAWASLKSFRPKDEDEGNGNGWGDFSGTTRSNDTHESKTDPEAKLARKGDGREAKLCFGAHAMMENRNGLVLELQISEANGRAERDVALDMLDAVCANREGVTVGADKAYDTRDFVAGCRARGATPHVAQNKHARRRSAIDGRTTRHEGYGLSQKTRRCIERIFGWVKTIGGLRRSRFRGRERTQLAATMVAAAYNLLRMSRLLAVA